MGQNIPPTSTQSSAPHSHIGTLPASSVDTPSTGGIPTPSSISTQPDVGAPPTTPMPHSPGGGVVPPVPSATPTAAFCSVPLMGQIPQIPRFTGEGRATGESFSEWHEHVATLVGWNDHWKLVHLTSNLRDTAMAFYRSCSYEVRSKYNLLVAAMKRRFTPIRLTAVQICACCGKYCER